MFYINYSNSCQIKEGYVLFVQIQHHYHFLLYLQFWYSFKTTQSLSQFSHQKTKTQPLITTQINTSLHQALYKLKTLLLASAGVVERRGFTTARPTVLVTWPVAILNVEQSVSDFSRALSVIPQHALRQLILRFHAASLKDGGYLSSWKNHPFSW